jgi:Cytochrome P460
VRRKLLFGSSLLAVVVCAGAAIAVADSQGVTVPDGFRNWFAVNSMIVTKDSAMFSQIGGMHIVYVNAKGLPTLKAGGPYPYPDGTIFADDVHDFTVKDGVYAEGPKKAVTVMIKDAKKYAETGGWGFQVFAGGDPAKPLVTDTKTACFVCHTPQKAQDFTFSTYIP